MSPQEALGSPRRDVRFRALGVRAEWTWPIWVDDGPIWATFAGYSRNVIAPPGTGTS